MTSRPSASKMQATMASTQKVGAARRRAPSDAFVCSMNCLRQMVSRSAARAFAPWGRRTQLAQVGLLLLLGQEARFLHQRPMHGLGFAQPLGVLRAGHEGLVERAFLHVFLPLRSFAHLL